MQIYIALKLFEIVNYLWKYSFGNHATIDCRKQNQCKQENVSFEWGVSTTAIQCSMGGMLKLS